MHYCNAADQFDETASDYAVYDAQGIYLTKVCTKCERSKLSEFRPEILAGYGQSDVDEPINPEP
jgi:hypothetical protein